MINLVKKIDILAPHLSGNGGIETVIRTVMLHFQTTEQQKKYAFRLVLPQGATQMDWTEGINELVVNQIKNPGKIKRQLFGTWYLWQYVRQTNAEIIICPSTRLVKMTAIFRKLLHRHFKIISWIHFSLYQEAAVKPKDLHYADYHLAISSGIQKQMVGLGIPAARIALIYNPLTPPQEQIVPTKKAEFVYVGRLLLDGQKNLRELVLATAKLHGDWHLTFYGAGSDRQALAQLIADHGLEAHYKFYGWTQQPWRQITAASSFVLTSKYEGFPMALLEAVSRGLPSIASNCPTGPDDIIQTVNGRLYQPGDIAGLAAQMQAVIDGKLQYDRQKVQASARKFYPDVYFERFEKALEMK